MELCTYIMSSDSSHVQMREICKFGCETIIRVTDEQLINFILSIFGYVQVSRNIVMEAHLIRPAHFTGITCTAYQRRELSPVSQGMEMATNEQQLHFRCSTGSHNTSLNNFPFKVRHEHPAVGLLQTAPSVICWTCIQSVLYICICLVFFCFVFF